MKESSYKDNSAAKEMLFIRMATVTMAVSRRTSTTDMAFSPGRMATATEASIKTD